MMDRFNNSQPAPSAPVTDPKSSSSNIQPMRDPYRDSGSQTPKKQ